MPERDERPARTHVPLSQQFLTTLVVAVAATLALVGIVLVQAFDRPAPPPGGGNGQPPGPPPSDALVIIAAAVFVLAWAAVMLTYNRDLITHRMGAIESAVGALRTQLADDHRADLAALGRQLVSLTEEFGEQRETDGYVNGLRQAGLAQPGKPPPRALHPVPPAE